MKTRNPIFLSLFLLASVACAQQSESEFPIQKSEKEWREALDSTEYHVLREKGTEKAFTGLYNDFKKKGDFHCAACTSLLFSSEHKYDSGSGWPAFWDLPKDGHVMLKKDRSYGMIRVEVLCSQCGGHLGHVFEDGPRPTGKRYCINSVALDFHSKEE
jgi:peptide-methionine (R)-S-oxide reductase